jgi:hypothetical protein
VIESAVATVRLKAFCVVCWGEPLSVARIVKLNEPLADGVPPIVPLAERLSPPGKEPVANVQVYGAVPLAAVKACE